MCVCIHIQISLSLYMCIYIYIHTELQGLDPCLRLLETCCASQRYGVQEERRRGLDRLVLSRQERGLLPP